MRLPRDVSGRQLAQALGKHWGYILTRQRGSHMRYTTQLHGEHHAAIPDHNPMRLGTLSGILKDIAEHHGLTVEELARKLKL
jgi:predicted RNA binding protein YcfA (HicA-like mRNA interferase family)